MRNPKPELDTLIASLFYLMSRFGKSKEPGLAEAITMHLQMVQEHPDSTSETINKTCRRLQTYWSSMNNDKLCKNMDTGCNMPMHSNHFNIH